MDLLDSLIRTKPRRRIIFDIENRPLSYWYDGNPTAEITVISWKWGHTKTALVEMQDNTKTPRKSLLNVLHRFRDVYEQAAESGALLIGHNIRRHDLPILNAQYIEQGFDPLPAILTQDTYADLVRWKDIPKSLEYLADLFDSPIQKHHMAQESWRRANRLTDVEALQYARKRCRDDVLISEFVYHELLDRKLLKTPRMWKP